MTLRILYLLIVAFLLLFKTTSMKAQFSIAIGPGLTSYSGDISGPNLKYVRPAGNFELWYQFNPYLYVNFGTSIYRLYGEDINPIRNRAFRANHFELYTGLILASSASNKIMPFLTAGIGITKVDPEHKVPLIGSDGYWWLNSSKWLPDGQPIPSPGIIFPLGAGFRIKVSKKISIVVDGALRYTNNDMIDGVSASEIYIAEINEVGKKYFETIRPEGIDEDKIGNGNPDANDVYGIFSIKVQFFIGSPIIKNKTFRFNGLKRGKLLCPAVIPDSR